MGKELLTLTVLRRRAGITQEELAAAIPRCSQPDVSMWEAGASIPKEKSESIFKLLSKGSGLVELEGLEIEDLSRPWDEVLLRLNGIAKAS